MSCHNLCTKNSFWIIIGYLIFSFTCSDTFIDDYRSELLAKRAEGAHFSLFTGTTIISFTENGAPGLFKAKLTAPPEANVVLDFTKSNQFCTTYGIDEVIEFTPSAIVFTPENYSEEQEVQVTVKNDMLVYGTRSHQIKLPPLESTDPLYNGIETPTVYITIFEDDVLPAAYPIMPYNNQKDFEEYKDIIIQFNKEIDEKTVNEQTIFITNQFGEQIVGYLWMGNDRKSVFFSPKNRLANGCAHTVTLTTAIKDVYGNALESNFSWNFTVRLTPIAVDGSYTTSIDARAITSSDNYAYVADYSNGLRIFDISNPQNPNNIGNYKHSEGYCYDVSVKDNYAYLAYGSGGLVIVDITNKSSPQYKVKYKESSGTAYNVHIAENYAYVGYGSSGLVIVDISNPLNPQKKGKYDTPGVSRGVFVKDAFAYVADSSAGLQIIDISNPANPQLIKTYDTPGTAFDVAVLNNLAFIADGSNGLVVLDIRDPQNPLLKEKYEVRGEAKSVILDGSTVYVADGQNGFFAIDYAYQNAPFRSIQYYDTPQKAYDIAINKNYIYLANSSSGFQIFHKDLPDAIYCTSVYSKDAQTAFIHGTHAYVANLSKGLVILDISNPFFPNLLATYDTPGSVFDVAVSNGYAYLADDACGLRIANIKNPATPATVASYDTDGNAYGITISFPYAFVADGSKGVVILNVSNPSDPQLITKYDTDSTSYNVALYNNYAIVADHTSGMLILDISTISNPSLKTKIDTKGYAYDVEVAGKYAYLADGPNGLLVYDLTNPENPQEVYSEDTAGNAQDISISGTKLLVADYTGGVLLFNISNPSSPSKLIALTRSGIQCVGVTASKNYVYAVDSSFGIHIFKHFYGE
ncbi:MAG: Ig-like domain-containing protein [Spirochaetes bacterium]|nr:Ig-like domain-containing protein [Spirochaetota bacterium]